MYIEAQSVLDNFQSSFFIPRRRKSWEKLFEGFQSFYIFEIYIL